MEKIARVSAFALNLPVHVRMLGIERDTSLSACMVDRKSVV